MARTAGKVHPQPNEVQGEVPPRHSSPAQGSGYTFHVLAVVVVLAPGVSRVVAAHGSGGGSAQTGKQPVSRLKVSRP